ncbi:TPA: helix-turn-helix transcriptional regulator [Providencia rettgeri]|uniref:helix-turn-helix domain-containing protein n=1 Tax=Providencia TaxID=586 RepID=UPI00234A50F5|nr:MULTISPECIES: helix-turn-helix transcriptional regulator [Providencia]MDU7494268.1 helix-turn-helix transcriptional regulator [Providencia rettgeri]HEM7507399.1 helix-turn-helix transcriptional regulator [Providencia rettgeri]HEM8267843.1 helix-turn-helix transcriptional regulator [Providencia rettgeri]HEM8306839.1 helix-turn-helix transcriptional regulator [Providencia rettgeri]
MLNIGLAMKQCRDAKNLTLQEMAEKSGLTKSYLSRIENSQRDPTISALEKISLALDIPLNILILLSEVEDEKDNRFNDINEILKSTIMDVLHNGKKLEL